MYLKNLNLDPDTIRTCQDALGTSLTNRKEFMQSLIVERLETANKRSMDEFDRCLNELSQKVNSQSDIFEITKVVKKLNRVSDKVCRNEFLMLKYIYQVENQP